MEYYLLLDLATDLGYRLAMCGAETYRVEESVNRILAAYGISSEAFALPNCLTVSIETDIGKPVTRMRRIGEPENDLDAVEKYTGLSRRICTEKPDPETAAAWLKDIDESRVTYSALLQYFGCFLGSFGFSVFYGGSLADGLCAGLCGVIGCASIRFFGRLSVNRFFRTIFSAFLMALVAYFLAFLHLGTRTDAIIIGCLMLLVPGLLFTNAMRDIIFGDTNSGINRVVQVLLIAISIALGTGAALSLASFLFEVPAAAGKLNHSVLLMILSCAAGCAGFCIIFNIHGPGGLLCTLGGVLTWIVYALSVHLGAGDIMAYFCASVFASLYAEIMARIRKFPAISYLVVSTFPLLPGGGIYFTMNYAVLGDMPHFSQQGIYSIAIAGSMAVGILLISTAFRLWAAWKISRRVKHR